MSRPITRLVLFTVVILHLGPRLLSQGVSQKPNIVFMMADNLGYGDVGVYGGGELRGAPTPRIDTLAAEGLRLTQFLVEPGCTPSRAATMTGRYSIRSGLSLVLVPGTPNTLQDEEVTLGELMKSVGYATAYYGKWHLGVQDFSLPHNQGFDEFYGDSKLPPTKRCTSRQAPRIRLHYLPILGSPRSSVGVLAGAWKTSSRIVRLQRK